MAGEQGSRDERPSGKMTYSEQFAIFDMPPVDMGVSKVRWVEYKPKNPLSMESPIEFQIFGNSKQYVDFRRTLLSVRLRILQGDGSVLPDRPSPNDDQSPASVGLVNLPLHALFKSVEVSLNQQLVTGASTLYPYKAMIDTLLNTTSEAKKSGQLNGQLFAEDMPYYMDTSDPWNGELDSI